MSNSALLLWPPYLENAFGGGAVAVLCGEKQNDGTFVGAPSQGKVLVSSSITFACFVTSKREK